MSISFRRILTALASIMFLAGFLFVVFYLARYENDNAVVQAAADRYGYLGVFLIALLSGFNFAVPVPAISFLPLFIALGKSPILTVFVISFGMLFADFAAYFLGRTGRRFLRPKGKIFLKLCELKERHYWLPLAALGVFAAVIPLPNEFLVIPLGFMHYKIKHIAIPLFLGNLVFNTFSAFGIVGLFNVIGASS